MNHLHSTYLSLPITATPPEALYPRGGFVEVDGKSKPYFLVHPDLRCEDCEAPFSSGVRHPVVMEVGGVDLRRSCENLLIKLVS